MHQNVQLKTVMSNW